MQKPIKSKCNGRWTKARYNSFIKSALRAASNKWPVKFDALKAAYVETKLNKITGRQSKHYRCAICCGIYPSSDIQIDHIAPVIPPSGFISWDSVIERMFCELDGYQALCSDCHDAKTKGEMMARKECR